MRRKNKKELWETVRVEFRWPRSNAEEIAKIPELPTEIRRRIQKYLSRHPMPASIQKREEFISQWFTFTTGDEAAQANDTSTGEGTGNVDDDKS
jgi:hypothetical protein